MARRVSRRGWASPVVKAPARPRCGRRRGRAPPPPGRGAGAGRSSWVSRAISLVDLDFRFADDRAPFVHFRLEKGGELLRRRADQRRAELLQSLVHHRMAERCDHVLLDLLDDGGRRLRWHEKGKPGRDVEARHAGFRDGRQIRRRRHAFCGGDRQSAHNTVPHVRQARRDVVEDEVEAAGNDVLQRRRRAAIGQMAPPWGSTLPYAGFITGWSCGLYLHSLPSRPMVLHSAVTDIHRTPKPMPKPRAARLETPTARRRLEVRKKPYWTTISPGIHLGYRRNAGAGTWSVRVADSGAEWVKRIAVADDLEPASPPHVLSYWQAIDVARSLARRQPGDPVDESRPLTVSEAFTLYEKDLVARGGNPYNAEHPRTHLPA